MMLNIFKMHDDLNNYYYYYYYYYLRIGKRAVTQTGRDTNGT